MSSWKWICAAMLSCLSVGSAFSQDCVNGLCSLERISRVERIDTSGIVLAPGEVLVSVNGVPVNQTGPVRQVVGEAMAVTGSVVTGTVQAVGHVFGAIGGRAVNRDPVAYEHALREAQILASRRMHGHPLGVAPGCSYSGTGTSFSSNSPNHCYMNLGEDRLVARAFVQGADGKYYWSAHYR
jgi:hypothetical protein